MSAMINIYDLLNRTPDELRALAETYEKKAEEARKTPGYAGACKCYELCDKCDVIRVFAAGVEALAAKR